MFSLPVPLRGKEFMLRLFRENYERWFFEPRHWRLALEDVKTIRVQFLNFSPPQYDILISVGLQNGQALQFYEGVIAKNTAEKDERVFGKVEISRSAVYFADGYTNRGYIESLFEAWCRHKKLGSLGFSGEFKGLSGDVHIQLKALLEMSKPGQEATTNYLYRYKGWAEEGKRKIRFDVVAKRFLPREPPTRGNHEYSLLRALPKDIVPNVHGALVNRRLKVDGEGQVLVLLTDYIEDAVEVGKQIWDTMKEISKSEGLGKDSAAELKRLDATVKEAIDRAVFPFHKAGFETWHSAGIVIKPEDEYYQWYHREFEQNLAVLQANKVISATKSQRISRVFRKSWNSVLSGMKATEIHGDLMWRQIMKTKDKRVIILDLDEHIAGHAAKDIADLCAANRFIAEDLRSPHAEYMRSIAERLNKLILQSYLENAKRARAIWAQNFEKAVLIYLAYRHLHDVAYYVPAWRQARKADESGRYERYVDFSLGWFEKSIKSVEAMLQ